jgi:hypothetical protein
MWPILIGFMFGVVVYVAVMWVHNQYGTLNDILDDIRVPFWLSAAPKRGFWRLKLR